jgi:hypothetical protein
LPAQPLLLPGPPPASPNATGATEPASANSANTSAPARRILVILPSFLRTDAATVKQATLSFQGTVLSVLARPEPGGSFSHPRGGASVPKKGARLLAFSDATAGQTLRSASAGRRVVSPRIGVSPGAAEARDWRPKCCQPRTCFPPSRRYAASAGRVPQACSRKQKQLDGDESRLGCAARLRARAPNASRRGS